MRRYVLPLLSALMIAVAIAIALSSPALRSNATAGLQNLKARVPTYAFSARFFRQGLANSAQQSPVLSPTTSSATQHQTLVSATGPLRPRLGQECQSSSTATATAIVMASTCPLPGDAAPEQKASASAAESLTSKSNAGAELPKLSAQDFRVYNRLAAMMDAYHNHFRYTWNILYKTCETGSRPAGMSLRAFISQGLHLCRALTIHHTIEEQHVFPELAERMPAFAPRDHLISQHEKIHEGLEKLEEYLDSCRSGEKELRLPELRTILDGFGEVLWTHLDDEVRMLGAENMRKYWTKQEILSMNW